MPQRNVKQTRLANFRALAAEVGGVSAMAARLRKSQSQWQNTIGKTPKKGIGDDLAREVEKAFGKPEGWADTPWDLVASAPASPAPAGDVEDFQTALKALLSVMATHRPVEARALADLLEPHTKPGTQLSGMVGALRGAPPSVAGSTGRKSRRA